MPHLLGRDRPAKGKPSADVQVTRGVVRANPVKIWESYQAQHTLFWQSTSMGEERLLQIAGISRSISLALMTLLGGIEIVFVLVLAWNLLK